MGGSISSGDGPQMQPHQNTPIPVQRINENLRVFKELVIQANNEPDNCLWIKYQKLLTQGLYGVGHLGAQHILLILGLLKVIQNPEYVRSTSVLQNTGTEKNHQALQTEFW